MRIATWNIERLKHRKRLPEIIAQLNEVAADILILTEADEAVKLPQYEHMYMSRNVESHHIFTHSEHEVIVYTSFKDLGTERTSDGMSSMCDIFETPFGPLAVYGTVIGKYGNRRPCFKVDLVNRIDDFDWISREYPMCIAGDFNISFSDNYYFTHHGRDTLNQSFKDYGLVNLTAHLPEAIDHIVVSKAIVKDKQITVGEWNLDKSLSDHKGVFVDIV